MAVIDEATTSCNFVIRGVMHSSGLFVQSAAQMTHFDLKRGCPDQVKKYAKVPGYDGLLADQ